jgi:hypothetical protein
MDITNFEINPDLQAAKESINERHILQVLKIMRETYCDLPESFHKQVDIVAEFIIKDSPLLLKLQQFFHLVNNNNICLAYLFMKNPKEYRQFIETFSEDL